MGKERRKERQKKGKETMNAFERKRQEAVERYGDRISSTGER